MKNKEALQILQNEKGIAIGMVLSAVVILTTIIANFTFETNVNKIKAYNIEDRAKARLTAESGVQFAMARLKLYKEAYNYLQTNESAGDLVKQETLNSLWNFPFIYPIPVSKKMNKIQKEAIADFQENTLIEGSMQLTITNVSNKINLNMVRISLIEQAEEDAARSEGGASSDDEASSEEDKEKYGAEAQLLSSLKNAIQRENENNEDFLAEFQGIEASELVNEVKFNISDPDSVEDSAGVDSNFQNIDTSPKRAPFMSLSELYSLPGWSDDIVNLIRNEFTVHGAIMIDLNRITDKLLKILIPDITDDDIQEFFKYKDNPDDPKFFNTLEDFKRYIVNTGNLMTEENFDERFEKFLKQGLQFGPTPSLFKLISQATVGRATYTITAFVVLPAQPKKIKETTEGEDEDGPADGSTSGDDSTTSQDGSSDSGDGSSDSGDEDPSDGADTSEDEEEQKTLLLNPRLVEIITS